MDWFGAYIIGLVTAIGGGTLRDLLLDVTPFWMLEGKYFLTTGVALIATLLFKDKLFKWGSTLFLFDTIGLGLFTIVGITKSIAGLYALACVAGGGVYFLCNYLILPTGISETIAALTVIVFRLIAVEYHLHLPQLQPLDSKSKVRKE